MKLSVEGGGGSLMDTEVRDVKVPDFSAPLAALSTPAVVRARTIPEFRTIVGQTDVVPTATRVFRRTDRLLIRFDTYGAGGSTPEVKARLLNRSGQSMSDVAIQPAPAGGNARQIDLALAGLAPGEYVLEIKASGSEKDEATELVAFRVTS
jgi:hypothetical protein